METDGYYVAEPTGDAGQSETPWGKIEVTDTPPKVWMEKRRLEPAAGSGRFRPIVAILCFRSARKNGAIRRNPAPQTVAAKGHQRHHSRVDAEPPVVGDEDSPGHRRLTAKRPSLPLKLP